MRADQRLARQSSLKEQREILKRQQQENELSDREIERLRKLQLQARAGGGVRCACVCVCVCVCVTLCTIEGLNSSLYICTLLYKLPTIVLSQSDKPYGTNNIFGPQDCV